MTKFLIITSTEDKASMNMRERFLTSDLFTFTNTEVKWQDNPILQLISYNKEGIDMNLFKKHAIYLGLTKKPLIFLDNLMLESSSFNPDILIFASRHASESGKPAFLIHSTGIWGDDSSFGGKPRELSLTSALLLKAGFQSLMELTYKYGFSDRYACDMEVTHHGPTSLEKPLIFMELGSNPEEWTDQKAALLVSEAIVKGIVDYLKYDKRKQMVGLGFGGRHYANQFKRIILEKEVSLSFICPKYFIQSLTREMIQKMIKNTKEDVDFFIIDWKGTNSEDKKHLIPLLEDFDIPIKKSKDF